jgi:hypothetical protein
LKLIAHSGKRRDYPCPLSTSKAQTRCVARDGRSGKNAIVLSRVVIIRCGREVERMEMLKWLP